MMVLPYTVEKCDRKEIKEFVEHWHYSHSINGLRTSYCFKLLDRGCIIGAALFGALGMANNWKKFANLESEVVELKRLCCIDNTLKNTESFFISRCIRWIKQNSSVKCIVSYADENYNHSGIIYQAANFEYLGITAPSKMILFNGKLYHDKSIRAKYNGFLKPFAIKLNTALVNGDAKYVDTKFKHCYIYRLDKIAARGAKQC